MSTTTLVAPFNHWMVAQTRPLLDRRSRLYHVATVLGLSPQAKTRLEWFLWREAHQATAHLYISNPFGPGAKGISRFFTTHPPIEERIKALRAMGSLK